MAVPPSLPSCVDLWAMAVRGEIKEEEAGSATARDETFHLHNSGVCKPRLAGIEWLYPHLD